MEKLKTPPELYFTRTTCRLCKSPDMTVAVPLPELPVASPNVGDAVTNVTAPADLHQCRSCGFLQLATIVNPEFQYRNFTYQTGVSVGLSEHFKDLIDGLAAQGEIGADKFVVDIGSNDGSLLKHVQQQGARVLGIDPAVKIAAAATAAGIPTLGEFFNAQLGKKIACEHGEADVIISNNTIANIDDLDDFFGGILALLAPQGMMVVETQYALDVIEKTLLDVIYHEHVSYFGVAPMQAYLAARGLELFDAQRIAPKGGSIRFLVQRKNSGREVSGNVAALVVREKGRGGLMDENALSAFRARIAEIGARLRDRLDNARKKNGRALVYGSSVGCAALIHYFDLGQHIDAVYDDMPVVTALRAGVSKIPVLPGEQLSGEAATDVLVLAWRYMEAIAARHEEFRAKGGRFYRALPDLAYAN